MRSAVTGTDTSLASQNVVDIVTGDVGSILNPGGVFQVRGQADEAATPPLPTHLVATEGLYVHTVEFFGGLAVLDKNMQSLFNSLCYSVCFIEGMESSTDVFS